MLPFVTCSYLCHTISNCIVANSVYLIFIVYVPEALFYLVYFIESTSFLTCQRDNIAAVAIYCPRLIYATTYYFMLQFIYASVHYYYSLIDGLFKYMHVPASKYLKTALIEVCSGTLTKS